MFFLLFLFPIAILRVFGVRTECPAGFSPPECPPVMIRVNLVFKLDTSRLITQYGQGEPVVVTSLGTADLSLRLLKLRLTQLNDGT